MRIIDTYSQIIDLFSESRPPPEVVACTGPIRA